MHRLLVFLFSVFWNLPANAESFAEIRFSPIENLVYQLDCAHDHISCSRDHIETFWKEDFLKKKRDREIFQQWHIDEPYSVNANIVRKIREASFATNNMEDFLSVLKTNLSPEQYHRVSQVMEYFYPRFMPYWNSQAEPVGTFYKNQLMNIFAQPNMQEMLKFLKNFYQTELPKGREPIIHLILRPGEGTSTRGEQIDHHAIVEFIPGENAKDRVDVFVHEMCHYFYANMPISLKENLRKSFYDDHSIQSTSLWNILDETLATSLANGMVYEMLVTPDIWQDYLKKSKSFYNSILLDSSAKLMLPLLKQWKEEGRTLAHPNAVPNYKMQLAPLKTMLLSPNAILMHMHLVMSVEDRDGMTEVFFELFRPNILQTTAISMDTEAVKRAIDYNDQLNTVFIFPSKNHALIQTLPFVSQEDYAKLMKDYKKYGPSMILVSRSPSTQAYIVLADDSTAVRRLFEDIAIDGR